MPAPSSLPTIIFATLPATARARGYRFGQDRQPLSARCSLSICPRAAGVLTAELAAASFSTLRSRRRHAALSE